MNSHISLEFRWGHWESFQVASGDLGLVSICDLELRVLLELQQGSRASVKLWLGTRVSPLVVTGNSGFLLSGNSGLRPHLSCRWECRETQGSCQVAAGDSELLYCLVGPQSFSQVVAWDTGFDLSLERRTQGSS